MKFSDILNEENDGNEYDRLYKKADLIYKALKTGIITLKNSDNTDLIKFKYVLPEWYSTNIINRLGERTAEITVENLSYKTIEGEEDSQILHHLSVMFNLIQQKFRRFGVSLSTDSFIIDFKNLDDESENLNEAYLSKHEDWDDEAKRVKKKVYTILKAHQRGVVNIPNLKGDRKCRYEFVDGLLSDIKGLGKTLTLTSTLDRETNHLILHPKLNLRDVYVKIWNDDGKEIDVTSFEFDGMDKSLVFHKIEERFRVFDIKINWGWTKSW